MSSEIQEDEDEVIPPERVVYLKCPTCGYRATLIDESDPPFVAEELVNLARIANGFKGPTTVWDCPRCSWSDRKTVPLEVYFNPFERG